MKWLAIGIVVAILLYAVMVYNRLVALRQACGQAWADVDVQLKQRHDLVPNLVETVKGYAAHERGTLEAVVHARAKATQVQLNVNDLTPENMQRFEQAQ